MAPPPWVSAPCVSVPPCGSDTLLGLIVARARARVARMEFDRRVYLVPGASGALGSAVTAAFLERGAFVAGVSRKWGGSDRVRKDRFLGIEADLTRPDGARIAVEKTLERTRRIDGLVHVMGGFAGGQTLVETDDDTWDRMINMNLRSAVYAIRAVLPHLLREKRGRIIAVGSRVAVEPQAMASAYGVSKAGVVALVRSVALELARTGVTANVVLPSIIDTPQNRTMDPSGDRTGWVKPESIASTIIWLASDGAADVNGAVVPVYGGTT